MPFPAMPTQVNCPQCGKTFVTQIMTVLDVGEDPELKQRFLKGEVNFAKCPDCGSGGTLSTLLVYHDPDKELLITYIPSELGLSADQQEKIVGDLVNTVMNSVPAEARKGYFLQPKSVLTISSLYDTILEADGISIEFLNAQRARLKLIDTLAAVVDDEESLNKLVDEHRDELKYEFFLTLSDVIEGYRKNEEQERATTLESLREKLLERVTPTMPSAASAGATYEEIIEKLQEAAGSEVWHQTVALNRPRLDYGFFQALTAKIDAAEGAGDTETAKKLSELRQSILEEIDAQNKIVHEAEDRASLLIMKLSEAQDVAKTVREHIEEIDNVFISVLFRYLEAARRQEDTERVEKLDAILKTVTDVIEEKLPPDARLINKLLRAEYPQGTNAVLEEHRGLLNDDFLKAIDEFSADLEKRGDQQAAEQLKNVREQIVAKITILRA